MKPLTDPLRLTLNTKAYIKHGWRDGKLVWQFVQWTQWNNDECVCMCVSKCKVKWFLTWGKLLFGMTWETIEKNEIHLRAERWAPVKDFSYKPRQTEAIGNTTLTVFFWAKAMSVNQVLSNLKLQKICVFVLWNTVLSPVHLWVAKYSCISVWNGWESVSRWWKSSQTAGRSRKMGGLQFEPDMKHPPCWLSSSQRHLSAKEPRRECWKHKKNNSNLFSTCTWMHELSNSRCDVLFYAEGKGLIWSFLALQMQLWRRGTILQVNWDQL